MAKNNNNKDDYPVDTSKTFTGWASTGGLELKPFSYHPRPMTDKDIDVEITHCGICGSDIHTITEGWGPLRLGPCIAGHEVVGTVVARGIKAEYSIGDRVGVGAVVDSCGECKDCLEGFEQMCRRSTTTYNDVYRNGGKGKSYGGYADFMRVNSQFAYKIPDNISSAEAAPLLCGGITTYAPLKTLNAGPDKVVGVMGIGGLGHISLLWAKAFNSKKVIAFSSSDNKREEASKLGADLFINTNNPKELKSAYRSCDILIMTSNEKDANYQKILNLVANRGTFVMLAAPESTMEILPNALLMRQVSMMGSLIGGRELTKEMLKFASEKNVKPWIEKLPMNDANAAVQKMVNGRPRYRIVMETEAANKNIKAKL